MAAFAWGNFKLVIFLWVAGRCILFRSGKMYFETEPCVGAVGSEGAGRGIPYGKYNPSM